MSFYQPGIHLAQRWAYMSGDEHKAAHIQRLELRFEQATIALRAKQAEVDAIEREIRSKEIEIQNNQYWEHDAGLLAQLSQLNRHREMLKQEESEINHEWLNRMTELARERDAEQDYSDGYEGYDGYDG